MGEVFSTNARWFDGRDSRERQALVRIHREHLELVPHRCADDRNDDEAGGPEACAAELAPRRYARASLEIGERWLGTPVPVALPDGGTVWLAPESNVARHLAPRGLAARLIGSWRGSLLCLLLLVTVLVWFDRQGAALLARAALPLISHKVDNALGDVAEKQIAESLSLRSIIPLERRRVLHARFLAIVEKRFPGVDVDLAFVRSKHLDGGFNAFALPNGKLYLLDGMTANFTDDELMAVLAHEVGHVKHRHTVRSMVAGVGLITVAQVAIGDYSGIAAQALGAVQTLRYSRDAEREADAEAQRVIREEGLPPDTLIKVWRTLRDHVGDDDSGSLLWLSTHPSTEERLQSAERAMQASTTGTAKP